MIKAIIRKKTRPIRRKMYIEVIINSLIFAFMIGSGIDLLLSGISHFIVFPYAIQWMIRAFAVVITSGLFVGLIRNPSMGKVIYQSDLLGAKERLQTSWEFSGSNSIEAQLQRQETIDFLQTTFSTFKYKMQIKLKPLMIGCIMLSVAVGLIFVPSKAKETADKQEAFHKEILAAQNDFLKDKESLLKDNPISEEDKKKLEETLKPLLDKLEAAKNEEEALKQLSIAKDELKKLELDADKNKLMSLSDLTKQIASLEQKAMTSTDKTDQEAIKKALQDYLNQLEEAAKQLDDDTVKNEVSKAISDLKDKIDTSDKIGGNEEAKKEANEQASLSAEALAEYLKNLAESNAADQVAKGIEEAINAYASNVSTDPSITDLAFNMQNSSSSSGQQNPSSGSDATSSSQSNSSDSNSSQAGQSGQNGQSGSGSSQSGQTGTDAGQTETGQTGTDAGQTGTGQTGTDAGQTGTGQTGSDAGQSGTGQSGSGTGQGGSGQGTGSGSGTGGGTGSGQGRGTGSVDSSLYSPTRLGGSSEPTYVQGTRNQSGDVTTQEATDKPLETGSLISYDELYREYYQQAQQNMSSLDVPVVMKDIILEYFSKIQ